MSELRDPPTLDELAAIRRRLDDHLNLPAQIISGVTVPDAVMLLAEVDRLAVELDAAKDAAVVGYQWREKAERLAVELAGVEALGVSEANIAAVVRERVECERDAARAELVACLATLGRASDELTWAGIDTPGLTTLSQRVVMLTAQRNGARALADRRARELDAYRLVAVNTLHEANRGLAERDAVSLTKIRELSDELATLRPVLDAAAVLVANWDHYRPTSGGDLTTAVHAWLAVQLQTPVSPAESAVAPPTAPDGHLVTPEPATGLSDGSTLFQRVLVAQADAATASRAQLLEGICGDTIADPFNGADLEPCTLTYGHRSEWHSDGTGRRWKLGRPEPRELPYPLGDPLGGLPRIRQMLDATGVTGMSDNDPTGQLAILVNEWREAVEERAECWLSRQQLEAQIAELTAERGHERGNQHVWKVLNAAQRWANAETETDTGEYTYASDALVDAVQTWQAAAFADDNSAIRKKKP